MWNLAVSQSVNQTTTGNRKSQSCQTCRADPGLTHLADHKKHVPLGADKYYAGQDKLKSRWKPLFEYAKNMYEKKSQLLLHIFATIMLPMAKFLPNFLTDLAEPVLRRRGGWQSTTDITSILALKSRRGVVVSRVVCVCDMILRVLLHRYLRNVDLWVAICLPLMYDVPILDFNNQSLIVRLFCKNSSTKTWHLRYNLVAFYMLYIKKVIVKF